jgi:hypothetical protein
MVQHGKQPVVEEKRIDPTRLDRPPFASFRWLSFGVHCPHIREHVTVILD